MGILLRIVGILWILGGLLVTAAAALGAIAANSTASTAYNIGTVIGAGLVLTPVWLTGIAFFLLPGWIRKQLNSHKTDVFS